MQGWQAQHRLHGIKCEMFTSASSPPHFSLPTDSSEPLAFLNVAADEHVRSLFVDRRARVLLTVSTFGSGDQPLKVGVGTDLVTRYPARAPHCRRPCQRKWMHGSLGRGWVGSTAAFQPPLPAGALHATCSHPCGAAAGLAPAV